MANNTTAQHVTGLVAWQAYSYVFCLLALETLLSPLNISKLFNRLEVNHRFFGLVSLLKREYLAISISSSFSSSSPTNYFIIFSYIFSCTLSTISTIDKRREGRGLIWTGNRSNVGKFD